MKKSQCLKMILLTTTMLASLNSQAGGFQQVKAVNAIVQNQVRASIDKGLTAWTNSTDLNRTLQVSTIHNSEDALITSKFQLPPSLDIPSKVTTHRTLEDAPTVTREFSRGSHTFLTDETYTVEMINGVPMRVQLSSGTSIRQGEQIKDISSTLVYKDGVQVDLFSPNGMAITDLLPSSQVQGRILSARIDGSGQHLSVQSLDHQGIFFETVFEVKIIRDNSLEFKEVFVQKMAIEEVRRLGFFADLYKIPTNRKAVTSAGAPGNGMTVESAQ